MILSSISAMKYNIHLCFQKCNISSRRTGLFRVSVCCFPLKATSNHDDVIKWKHFPHNWPFVRGIHRSPVNSPHKGQWRGALMFILICARINGLINNREAGDLIRHRAHYDVIEMMSHVPIPYRRGSKSIRNKQGVSQYKDVVLSVQGI